MIAHYEIKICFTPFCWFWRLYPGCLFALFPPFKNLLSSRNCGSKAVPFNVCGTVDSCALPSAQSDFGRCHATAFSRSFLLALQSQVDNYFGKLRSYLLQSAFYCHCHSWQSATIHGAVLQNDDELYRVKINNKLPDENEFHKIFAIGDPHFVLYGCLAFADIHYPGTCAIAFIAIGFLPVIFFRFLGCDLKNELIYSLRYLVLFDSAIIQLYFYATPFKRNSLGWLSSYCHHSDLFLPVYPRLRSRPLRVLTSNNLLASEVA